MEISSLKEINARKDWETQNELTQEIKSLQTEFINSVLNLEPTKEFIRKHKSEDEKHPSMGASYYRIICKI